MLCNRASGSLTTLQAKVAAVVAKRQKEVQQLQSRVQGAEEAAAAAQAQLAADAREARQQLERLRERHHAELVTTAPLRFSCQLNDNPCSANLSDHVLAVEVAQCWFGGQQVWSATPDPDSLPESVGATTRRRH